MVVATGNARKNIMIIVPNTQSPYGTICMAVLVACVEVPTHVEVVKAKVFV